MDDLTFQKTANGAVAVDVTGNATGTKGKTVYTKEGDQEGLFDLHFRVKYIDDPKPTKYKWDTRFAGSYAPTYDANQYVFGLKERARSKFIQIY